ncbi:DsbA family oxidoreductase [Celeribacter halophilus]|uniref:Predicted dithiol-disulfide isomerase, DsbA family n=1 Tax=Celeribacter halophilus TaxID=576117 RepID=A0A1I3TBT7_9RHOB|nr:DsbA family oxidoreductase [Celeribacter halophilus]PZX11139.1 putative DsbA family dithiol-disulfide isomerase [Celeribacter halophilus]SFJ68425.1 Predicted dithiol-disulfide isomerase, DsbA family [Celeribacter halophilus]
MITLDIFHDPICPWCYIGKTRLDRALEARPDHPFAIQWHPFQLNPTMPKEGMDRLAYLESKFHGTEGALKAYKPIIDVMHKELPQADLGKIKRTPNTLDAHRLIHWAGIEGRQTAAISSLFRAYFKDGRDIGSRAVLAELAAEIEMDADAIARLLDTDADVDEIKRRDAHARERGINGVPFFIVGNQHAVSGAQPTDLWLNVIDELTERNAL